MPFWRGSLNSREKDVLVLAQSDADKCEYLPLSKQDSFISVCANPRELTHILLDLAIDF